MTPPTRLDRAAPWGGAFVFSSVAYSMATDSTGSGPRGVWHILAALYFATLSFACTTRALMMRRRHRRTTRLVIVLSRIPPRTLRDRPAVRDMYTNPTTVVLHRIGDQPHDPHRQEAHHP